MSSPAGTPAAYGARLEPVPELLLAEAGGIADAGGIAEASGIAELRSRLRKIPPPPAVLDRKREHALTRRQRQVLDGLDRMFDDGFADLTMVEIASRSKCSLRTLYGVAPSRDELVLVVVDRSLWRVGRTAMAAIAPDMTPVDALRSYLRTANEAVAGMTDAFARDLDVMPAARRLGDFHADYVVAVTRCLLDVAVERGDIATVDTEAAAQVMAGLARLLSRPGVRMALSSSPKLAADCLVDVLLSGLQSRGAAPVGGALPVRCAAPAGTPPGQRNELTHD